MQFYSVNTNIYVDYLQVTPWTKSAFRTEEKYIAVVDIWLQKFSFKQVKEMVLTKGNVLSQ